MTAMSSTDEAIMSIAKSNDLVAKALEAVAETLKENQAISKMAIDVATLAANSRYEREHREDLSHQFAEFKVEQRAQMQSLLQTVSEDGKAAAVAAFKGKVMWGALCTGLTGATAIAWHTITGKGG